MFIPKVSKPFGSRMSRSDWAAFRGFRKSLEREASFQRVFPWTGYIKNEPWEMSVKVRGEKSAPRNFLHFVRKSHRSNSLLVLTGPQCSGKTTLLKKTQMDMFALTPHVMPIYVDLTKWAGEWNDENTPAVSDLVAFIKNSLADTSWDEWTIRDHFDAWHRAGRLFFIFDAIDEIPFVLHAKDSTRMATQVLHLIHLFLLSGGRYQGVISAGVDSTSFFTISNYTEVIMLPVSERVILKELDSWQLRGSPNTKDLLIKNPYWMKMCGNPAVLSMMLGYFSNGGRDLPSDLDELFDGIISQRFKSACKRLQELGVSEDAIRWAAQNRALSLDWKDDCVYFANAYFSFHGSEIPWKNASSALTYMEFFKGTPGHRYAFASFALRLYFFAAEAGKGSANLTVTNTKLDGFVLFPTIARTIEDETVICNPRDLFLWHQKKYN